MAELMEALDEPDVSYHLDVCNHEEVVHERNLLAESNVVVGLVLDGVQIGVVVGVVVEIESLDDEVFEHFGNSEEHLYTLEDELLQLVVLEVVVGLDQLHLLSVAGSPFVDGLVVGDDVCY